MRFVRAQIWYALTVLILAICTPLFAQAALVNINTASAAELETLPGIGPSKAAAIIDYRTLNGPFARTEDIQNVSGIGPATYANIASLITVGESGGSSGGSSSTATTSEAVAGAASAYTPPPSSLTLDIGSDRTGLVEVPMRFSATVKAKGASADTGAVVHWNFGDGSHTEGRVVEKVYQYPGTYLVTARADNGEALADDDLIVRIGKAQARIVSVTLEGVTLANEANERIDLSGWRLSVGSGRFYMPEGTVLLPKSSVLFPSAITRLSMATEAELRYPQGTLAVRFDMNAPPETQAVLAAQPLVDTSGSHEVQTVEPLITDLRIALPEPAYVPEAVLAPATANELAAVGAASPTGEALDSTRMEENANRSTFSELLRSPWTLGFLGVLVLAGGALMIL